MAYTLTNYPGVTLPDTGDPESTASGRISGGAGPTLAKSYDGHNHTVGKGLQIPTAGLDIDADLDMGGNRLVNVAEVRASGDVALAVNRSLGFTGGELTVITGAGQSRQLTNRPFSRMLNIFGGKLDTAGGAAAAEYNAAALGNLGALSIQPTGVYTGVYGFGVDVESGVTLNGFRAHADNQIATVELVINGTPVSTASGFAAAPGDEQTGGAFSHLVTSADSIHVRVTTVTGPTTGLVRYIRLDGIRP